MLTIYNVQNNNNNFTHDNNNNIKSLNVLSNKDFITIFFHICHTVSF